MNDPNIVQPGRPPLQDVLIIWLQIHLPPTARATLDSPRTYLVKHVAERAIRRYVPESALHAAARQLGYPLTATTIGVRWRDLGKASQ